MRRWLIGFVVLLAGCGAISSQPSTDDAALASGAAALPESAVVAEPLVGHTDPANPGFLTGDQIGEYYRLEMPADHLVTDWSTVVNVLSTPREIPAADIDAAVEASARFATEELAASSLAFNYTANNAKQWWSDHATSFAPDARSEIQQDFLTDINNSRGLLYTNKGWDRGTPILPSRISDLEIELTGLTFADDSIQTDYRLAFNAPVTGIAGSPEIYSERTVLHVRYDMVQIDGSWLIAGYDTDWQSTYRIPPPAEREGLEELVLDRN